MEDLIEKKDGELLQKHACDSSDYLIAVACGAVSGLVDIFLVGAPSQSVIGKWTDAQVDEAVKKFAEKSGWSPRPGKEGNVFYSYEHHRMGTFHGAGAKGNLPQGWYSSTSAKAVGCL